MGTIVLFQNIHASMEMLMFNNKSLLSKHVWLALTEGFKVCSFGVSGHSADIRDGQKLAKGAALTFCTHLSGVKRRSL